MDTQVYNEAYMRRDNTRFKIQIIRNEGIFKVFIDKYVDNTKDSEIINLEPYFLRDIDGFTNTDIVFQDAKNKCDNYGKSS